MLIEWAAGSAGRCLPIFRGKAPASGNISGEPRGAHAIGTVSVDRHGRNGDAQV
jgi:hypothetical protein